MKSIKENGVTLLALVITIMLMIILSAIAIKLSIDGALFGKAYQAIGKYQHAETDEKEKINNVIYDIDKETAPSIDNVDDSKITFITSTNNWTNGDVSVEISKKDIGYTLQYSIGNIV